MTTDVDIVNRALSLIGTRSTIASLNEGSNESIAANTWVDVVRDEVARLAPWNSVMTFNTLTLICAAPGTPENPTGQPVGAAQWQRGLPLPPWSYEYNYPLDCLRPLWIVPQFQTGFASGIPITTAVTGGAPAYWNGPPVKFKVATDLVDPNTNIPSPAPPVGTGVDTKIVLTNQEFALLVYNKQITNPNLMDSNLQSAWAMALAGRLVWQLNGNAAQANMKLQEANNMIMAARSVDGNEGLTINNVTPDWIRIRGIDYPYDQAWSPNIQYDWGAVLTLY
jgi:hypothetical protein